ncbi:acyl carrier protein [Flavonifractor sp. An52]|uniref:acyl carrier protein n=1 Tax=Flavonifractor sp. An52 TaxID=1965642 RepID=UPI000B38ACFE|nr:acyl carrier protein [Flavonifractor sp. An52]OUN81301.1 acyl carrier protein [Flavonifractor sp. An52]
MDFEKIKDIIVETLSCDADKVTPDARLAEDLEADSLAAVELSMALEEAFGVTIADEDLPNMKTAGDLMKYIEDHAE